MPTDIVDLDELLDTPKRVKLGGKIYKLPAQLPVPQYLRLRAEEAAYQEALATNDADFDQRVRDLNELLLELFHVHQPEMETLPAGLLQMFAVIPRVYGGTAPAGGGDDDPKPTTRARTGSGNTRARKTSKSRS